MQKSIATLCCCLIPFFVVAQHDTLWKQLEIIAVDAQGKVSISARIIEDNTLFEYYGDEMCVLQSVFKFPVALAILDKIDKGEFSLQHKIHFTPEFVQHYTLSTMRDSFYGGNINITFDKLIHYMIAQSDNIACDALIHHLGKVKYLEKYLHKLGIEDVSIKYDEMGMHKKWQNQYRNICSSNAMTLLLTKFYTGKVLSKTNTDYLYQVMMETSTGVNRIINLLPQGTEVAHKTGTSDTQHSITPAVNDCGIIHLPNGKHLALAIFVNDSKATQEIMESVIARVAKVLYDHYAHMKN